MAKAAFSSFPKSAHTFVDETQDLYPLASQVTARRSRPDNVPHDMPRESTLVMPAPTPHSGVREVFAVRPRELSMVPVDVPPKTSTLRRVLTVLAVIGLVGAVGGGGAAWLMRGPSTAHVAPVAR